MKSLNIIYLVKILKTPGIWVGSIFLILFMSFFPSSLNSSLPPNGANELALESTFLVCGSIIATALSIVIFQSWGYVFANIKTSDIDRRIKTSNLTKIEYYLYAYLYSFFIFLGFLIFSLSVFAIYDSVGLINNFYDDGFKWDSANWVKIVASYLIVYIISISIYVASAV